MDPGHRVLVAGAGGALGAAVLQQLLSSDAIERVGALTVRPIGAALHGFVAVADDAASIAGFGPRTALVVFGARLRAPRVHAHGAGGRRRGCGTRCAAPPRALDAVATALDDPAARATGAHRDGGRRGRCAVQHLPAAPAGTRVLPAALLWQAAQRRGDVAP